MRARPLTTPSSKCQGDYLVESDRLRRMATEGLAWYAFWTGYRAFERGDVPDCDEQLNIARSFLPEIADSREWARLGWKKRMGPRAWSVAKIFVRAVRRGHVRSAGRPSSRPRPSEQATAARPSAICGALRSMIEIL